MLIARRIGLVKKMLGLPIKDHAREVKVLEKWLTKSMQKGLPEDLVREIVNLLIRYSILFEASQATRTKNVALLGYGRMASTLGMMIKKAGHSLKISGRDVEKAKELSKIIDCESGDPHSIIRDSEYVILALSREAFEDGYVDTLSVHMKDKVVMDILSTKSGIYEKMERLSEEVGFRYISTHPLFGPLSLPYGETIVLIPSRSAREVDDVVDFWFSVGLSPIVADYEEHERAMAIVQVLPHMFLIALSETMKILSLKYNVKYQTYRTYLLKIVERALERVESNLKSVMEVQKHNKYADEARRIGIEVLTSVAQRLRGGC